MFSIIKQLAMAVGKCIGPSEVFWNGYQQNNGDLQYHKNIENILLEINISDTFQTPQFNCIYPMYISYRVPPILPCPLFFFLTSNFICIT